MNTLSYFIVINAVICGKIIRIMSNDIIYKINICNEKEMNIGARVNVSFMETKRKHTRKKRIFPQDNSRFSTISLIFYAVVQLK